MQYLLDTNAWIVYLKDPNSSIRPKLASISPKQVVTCSVVLSELLHGAEKYGNRLRIEGGHQSAGRIELDGALQRMVAVFVCHRIGAPKHCDRLIELFWCHRTSAG